MSNKEDWFILVTEIMWTLRLLPASKPAHQNLFINLKYSCDSLSIVLVSVSIILSSCYSCSRSIFYFSRWNNMSPHSFSMCCRSSHIFKLFDERIWIRISTLSQHILNLSSWLTFNIGVTFVTTIGSFKIIFVVPVFSFDCYFGSCRRVFHVWNKQNVFFCSFWNICFRLDNLAKQRCQ
jgi:hypothetical protein